MSEAIAELKKLLVKELSRLRRFAYSLTGDRADADDLVQALIEKMLRVGMPENVNPIPWLLKVCKNLWLDEIRARNVRVKAVEEEKIPHPGETEGDVNEIAYDADRVLEAMQQLTEDARLVISLVVIEGFSYAEAAEIMDVPIGTVMSRVARARSKLLTLLESNERGAE